MKVHTYSNSHSGKKKIFLSTLGILLYCAHLFFPALSFGWDITWQLPSLDNKKNDASSSKLKNAFPFFLDHYIAGGYPYGYPEKSKVTIDEKVFKNGEVSLRFDLVPADYSGGAVCLYKMVYNVKPYLKKGALQFWIKGETGTEIAWIALVDDDKGDGKKTVVRLPVALFGKISQEWSFISIPLKDFGLSGVYWDEKMLLELSNGFDWEKTAEIRIEVKKEDNNKSFRVWADDIVIVKDQTSNSPQ